MSVVTVIIPNYNGMAFLENCLKSVLSGDTEPDVIVVDNGSDDGSAEYVKKAFPGVKLIALPENTGFARAVNEGIRACKTPYVFLLNNDTVIRKDTVSLLVKAMEDYPDAFAFQAKMLKMSDPEYIDSAGDYYCALGWAFALGKDRKDADYMQYTDRRRIFSACAGAAIYRRSILDEIGLFDENHFAYLEDVDLGYRAKLYGHDSFLLPGAVVLHQGSASSGSRYNEFKIRLSSKNSIYLIYKNMPALQILLNLPFLLAGFFIKILFFARRGYGRIYVSGLLKGLSFCFTKKASEHKIPFERARFRNYRNVEIILLLNIIRRLL